MRVTLASYWDNAGQLQLLAEALRQYSNHDALHLNIQKTYLDYDVDLYYPDFKDPMRRLELKEKLDSYSDFYIFSEFLPHSSQLAPVLSDLGILRRLTSRNTIIRLSGSVARASADAYLLTWLREGFVFTGTTHDWSHFGRIGRIVPTRNICPFDKIPKPKPSKDKVRVCFAPTKKEKGVDEFVRVMDTLTEKYDHVEAVPITGKPWRESVKIKSECNVTFDRIGGTAQAMTYGNSVIESMFLGHAVLSSVDLFTLALYPDLPVVNIQTERDLLEALTWLVENPEQIKELGKRGQEFVEKWHEPRQIAAQWSNLIEFVKNEM